MPAFNESDTTFTIGNEDTAAGQLWNYIGEKQRSGTAVEEAGLTNGTNYVLDLLDESVSTDAQFRSKYGKGEDVRFNLSEVGWDQSGKAQNAEALADGLTLNRIEDGAWDRAIPTTTTSSHDRGRQGRGHAHRPHGSRRRRAVARELQGHREARGGRQAHAAARRVRGAAVNKPDNMAIDKQGNLLMQEDPGNNEQLARIVAYDIDSGRRGVLARFDADLFSPGVDESIIPSTIDEESSGIIDAAEQLGEGWFVFDAQVHRDNPNPEYVEYGQLLAMEVEDFDRVYTIKR